MSQSQTEANEPQAAEAVVHLEAALEILDQLDMPADIGAHVDLAIHRLRERLQETDRKQQA